MKPDQLSILREVADAGGRVAPDHFKGRGIIVSGLVRRGLCEWERGRMPHSLNATALLITDAGRLLLSHNSGTP